MTPDQFRKIRLSLGMNTTQLAYHIPCVERHVRRMEAGERNITPEVAKRMEMLLEGKSE